MAIHNTFSHLRSFLWVFDVCFDGRRNKNFFWGEQKRNWPKNIKYQAVFFLEAWQMDLLMILLGSSNGHKVWRRMVWRHGHGTDMGDGDFWTIWTVSSTLKAATDVYLGQATRKYTGFSRKQTWKLSCFKRSIYDTFLVINSSLLAVS